MAAVTVKDLAKHIKIKGKDEFRALRDLMEDLERKGIVSADDRGKFTYVRRKEKKENSGSGQQTSNRIRGTLFMTRRGFGFVSIEGSDDEIYIAPKYLHTALHSDVVEVVQFAGRPRGSSRGLPANWTTSTTSLWSAV